MEVTASRSTSQPQTQKGSKRSKRLVVVTPPLHGNDNTVYIVERVLQYKRHRGRTMAYIKWRDFPESLSTWEPVDAIFDLKDTDQNNVACSQDESTSQNDGSKNGAIITVPREDKRGRNTGKRNRRRRAASRNHSDREFVQLGQRIDLPLPPAPPTVSVATASAVTVERESQRLCRALTEADVRANTTRPSVIVPPSRAAATEVADKVLPLRP